MEVVNHYLANKGKCIILLSGLFYCGFRSLPRKVAKLLGLQLVELHHFYKPDYNKEVEVGTEKMLDWDSYKAINWNEFNRTVSEKKEKGVLVSGKFFPSEFLKFTPDLHLHFTLEKDFCLQHFSKYLDKQISESGSDLISKELELKRMEEITIPRIKKSVNDQVINKFFKIKEKTKEFPEEISVFIVTKLANKVEK